MPPPLLNRQTSSPPTLSVQHTLNSGVFIQNVLSIRLSSLPSFKELLKITPLPPYLSHIPGKYVIFFNWLNKVYTVSAVHIAFITNTIKFTCPMILHFC